MERFSIVQRVIAVETFYLNVNVRRKQCENSEPLLAEMKLGASLLYADYDKI